jgi:hypothetical protein
MAKADVYSYDVVLLETVTCCRSMELEEVGEEWTLMELAHEYLVAGEVRRVMVSDDADDDVEAAEVERAVKVAVWCAQTEPQVRPAMRNVSPSSSCSKGTWRCRSRRCRPRPNGSWIPTRWCCSCTMAIELPENFNIFI